MPPNLRLVEAATIAYCFYNHIVRGVYRIHEFIHKVPYYSRTIFYIQVNTDWAGIFSFAYTNEGFQYIVVCSI